AAPEPAVELLDPSALDHRFLRRRTGLLGEGFPLLLPGLHGAVGLGEPRARASLARACRGKFRIECRQRGAVRVALRLVSRVQARRLRVTRLGFVEIAALACPQLARMADCLLAPGGLGAGLVVA